MTKSFEQLRKEGYVPFAELTSGQKQQALQFVGSNWTEKEIREGWWDETKRSGLMMYVGSGW